MRAVFKKCKAADCPMHQARAPLVTATRPTQPLGAPGLGHGLSHALGLHCTRTPWNRVRGKHVGGLTLFGGALPRLSSRWRALQEPHTGTGSAGWLRHRPLGKTLRL